MGRKIIMIFFTCLFLLTGCISTMTEKATVVPEPIATGVPEWYPDLLRLGDGGFLAGDPCEPPCFLGITPGESTFEDVGNMLVEQGISQWCGHGITPQGSVDEARINCMSRGFYENSLWFKFDEASIVTLIGFDPGISISIGDIIGVYGDPSQIMIMTTVEFEYFVSEVNMRFDNLRLSVSMPTSSERIYHFDSKSAIGNLVFSDPETYMYISVGGRYSVMWQGFGDYEDPSLSTLSP